MTMGKDSRIVRLGSGLGWEEGVQERGGGLSWPREGRRCCGTRLRFVHSIHAPKSHDAAGPVACQCGSVRCRWAIFSRAATAHSVTECKETGRGDETPLPARAYHALRVHKSQPSPKNAFTSQECTKGKGQCDNHPRTPYYYTMMMSAAVLARRLIGTC